MLSNLSLDQFNDNVIGDISVHFECVLDGLSKLSLLRNLFLEKISHRDASPPEVFTQSQGIFFAVAARGTHNQNSADYTHNGKAFCNE